MTRFIRTYEKINISIDTFFVTWGYGIRRLGAASPWGEMGSVIFILLSGVLMTLFAENFSLNLNWMTRTILAIGIFFVVNGFVAVIVPLTHPYPKLRTKKIEGKQ